MRRILPILAALAVAAAAAVYLHNGRCFACEEDAAVTESCAKHIGPCTT
ncbi:MAG TPA: hypothetical protein VE713_02885 [Pyrinomonadaceae bacterium]|jgi:hypothetical protein|nr:hypothetical protein [Pyrinomonadaceae bacterium]